MNRQATGLLVQNAGVISQGDSNVLSNQTFKQDKSVKFGVAETERNSRVFSDQAALSLIVW
jgi:hypothetical protein